jgi:hypothetical protein
MSLCSVQHHEGAIHILDVGKAKIIILHHIAVQRRLLFLGYLWWARGWILPYRASLLLCQSTTHAAALLLCQSITLLASSLTSSHGETFQTLVAAGRKPGQLTPSQTPYPYDQFWPRCQYGVYIAVRVV